MVVLILRSGLRRLIVLVLRIRFSFPSFSLHSIRFRSSTFAPILLSPHLSTHLSSHRIPCHSILSLLLLLRSSKPSRLSPPILIHRSTRTTATAALRRWTHAARCAVPRRSSRPIRSSWPRKLLALIHIHAVRNEFRLGLRDGRRAVRGCECDGLGRYGASLNFARRRSDRTSLNLGWG